MEAASYKQTYKISVDSVDGIEGIKKLCNEELLNNSMKRFSSMHEDFAKAFQNIK